GPLLSTLQSALSQLSVPPPPTSAPPIAPSIGTSRTQEGAAPAVVAPPTLVNALREAYDNLCLLVEYKGDRLVDLPRLYHETKKQVPALTVKDYHDELARLWRERAVELHVLNEVRRASEPQLGIRQGDSLYYYLYWNAP